MSLPTPTPAPALRAQSPTLAAPTEEPTPVPTPSPTPEPTPEPGHPDYDCNGDGNNDCGSWDILGFQCRGSDEDGRCEYRFKFGDLLFDHSCRCKLPTEEPTQAPMPVPTPSPTPEPTPEQQQEPTPEPGHPDYDCNGDGNNDCGSWDILGFQCRDSDEDGRCEYRFKFGDLLFDHSCRCKLPTEEPTPAPAPTLAPTLAPTPAECTVPVPQWLLDGADNLVGSTLRTALVQADPLPLKVRDTELEQDFGICKLQLNGSTLNTIIGMSSVSVSRFQCVSSECLQTGPEGCIAHRIKLESNLDFSLLHGQGHDNSTWQCGSQLPKWQVDFSYDLIDTNFRVGFVFDLTYEGILQTPTAKVLEVSDLVTDLGTMVNHQCRDTSELPPEIVEPMLRVFCRPALELIGGVFRNLYFPLVDHTLQVVVNAVLTPKDGNGAFPTQPLSDTILFGSLWGVGLVCFCCCCVVWPRARQPQSGTVPAVLGVAVPTGVELGTQPGSSPSVPRGWPLLGSRLPTVHQDVPQTFHQARTQTFQAAPQSSRQNTQHSMNQSLRQSMQL